jgi:hypothetical protein
MSPDTVRQELKENRVRVGRTESYDGSLASRRMLLVIYSLPTLGHSLLRPVLIIWQIRLAQRHDNHENACAELNLNSRFPVASLCTSTLTCAQRTNALFLDER